MAKCRPLLCSTFTTSYVLTTKVNPQNYITPTWCSNQPHYSKETHGLKYNICLGKKNECGRVKIIVYKNLYVYKTGSIYAERV